MTDARPLRDVFDELAGDPTVTGPAADPADVLARSGHGDLPGPLVAEAIVSYADTAPVEVAAHLAPFVTAHSAVPLAGPGAAELADPAAGLDLLATAPAGRDGDGAGQDGDGAGQDGGSDGGLDAGRDGGQGAGQDGGQGAGQDAGQDGSLEPDFGAGDRSGPGAPDDPLAVAGSDPFGLDFGGPGPADDPLAGPPGPVEPGLAEPEPEPDGFEGPVAGAVEPPDEPDGGLAG
jgi:hypothetical protein